MKFSNALKILSVNSTFSVPGIGFESDFNITRSAQRTKAFNLDDVILKDETKLIPRKDIQTKTISEVKRSLAEI